MGVRGKDRFLRVDSRGELEAPSGFDSLVTVGMSPNGPVAMWSSSAGAAELNGRDVQQPGGASFARTVPNAKPAVALAGYSESAVVPATIAQVRSLPMAFPHSSATLRCHAVGGACYASWVPLSGGLISSRINATYPVV